MSILSNLTQLLKVAAEPVPLRKPNIKVGLDTDPADMISDENLQTKPSDNFDDAVFLITYEDSRGDESERTIRIKGFSLRGDRFYISAYCFFRQSFRSFRVDRVSLICDADTGEVLSESSLAFFAEGLEGLVESGSVATSNKTMKDYKQAYNMLYPGIKVLAYIARCDGHFHEKELATIGRYCVSVILSRDYELPFDEDFFKEYARRQCPSYRNFKNAITSVQNRDSDIGNRILERSVASLIEADGHIHQQEILSGNAFTRLWDEIEAKRSKEILTRFK